MALVSLTGFVDGITGKLSGSVFQFTNGGLQLRTRVNPRNPGSLRQLRSRASLTTITQQWPLLSSTDRESWVPDEADPPSRIDYFTTINQLIAYAGQPLLTFYTGLADAFTLSPVILDLSSTAFAFSASGSWTTTPANTYLNVYVTKQKSGGIQFINDTSYYYLLTMPPGTDISSPIDIFDAYADAFGVPVDGNTIGLRVRTVNAVDGFATPASAIIANVPVVP